MEYELKRVSPEVPRRLVEKYKCDLLSATILARRGITDRRDIKYYLESSINYLHSPFLFEDMDSAVIRINDAIKDHERICIFGDRDADGITATTIMVRELKRLGADVFYMLPEGDDPYGLTDEAVKKICDEKASLVITVDCGISCIKEIDSLNKLGIDTIVTDHHISGDDVPDAVAVIDPKVPSSGYPFEHLAGCGVAAKLIWALRFSQTKFYSSSVILLHALPGPGDNTTTVIEAVQLDNLVERGRVIEEVPNGVMDLEHSRVVSFLTRQLPILVLDKDIELRALRQAFGNGVDIMLYDIREELEKVIPAVKGKSLFDLSKQSRAVMYSDGHEELETLISLFQSCCSFQEPLLSSEYEGILDIVALGTIADLMPLKDENRVIVKAGLKRINQHPREAIVQLLSAQNLLGRPITTTEIGWYITPVINSSGRLGCPRVAVDLLLSDDISICSELTKKLISLNKERQKLGEESYDFVKAKAEESLESFGSKFIMVKDSAIPRGLTGNIASKVLRDYPQVPAVMIIAEAEEGRLSGSMRSRGSFNCRSFLSLFEDIVNDFGGHKAAGGFSLDAEKFEEFEKFLDEEVLKLDEDQAEEQLTVDALIPPQYMNSNLIKIVELFEPYGEQNFPLNFLIEHAEIKDCICLGENKEKGNLKLTIKYGNSLWPCLYWNSKDAFKKNFDVGDKVKMVFRLGRNYYRGVANLQLTVVALEKE